MTFRMSRALGICLAIGAIAMICVGAAYALTPYYGYSYSQDNTTGTSALAIDIYVNNGEGYVPLTADIAFPAYNGSATEPVAIQGDYEVKISSGGSDATGYLRLWCDMANDASWALIERMYVTFEGKVDGSGDPIEYDFGVLEKNSRMVTGQPTEAIQLTGEVPFMIYVKFANIGYTVDSGGDPITSFAGSKFIFAADGVDPFTS